MWPEHSATEGELSQSAQLGPPRPCRALWCPSHTALLQGTSCRDILTPHKPAASLHAHWERPPAPWPPVPRSQATSSQGRPKLSDYGHHL